MPNNARIGPGQMNKIHVRRGKNITYYKSDRHDHLPGGSTKRFPIVTAVYTGGRRDIIFNCTTTRIQTLRLDGREEKLVWEFLL